ncbi:ADP-ribosylglycohydrolase family protein [Nonomuraea sp. NPDC049709]|uniref:ADP-ribosylglycohydrolase family protein n=1 Tax=Nonomuraea sp. NPDC049709 TaxID=3154736 RepID=UPI00343391CD
MDALERAAGAVVGSAVGDALGAPFEFGPAGAFSARFPGPGAGGEMCGGGGWTRPGASPPSPTATRAAWEGTAIFHDLVRVALDGGDSLEAIPQSLAAVPADQRARYATVLDPRWHPDRATEFNGAVWPCLGSAVWALRTTYGYEDAVRAAIDLGGDTDTVAAVTGGLAGAVHGLAAIPARWTEPLHVPLPGGGGRTLRLRDLIDLARRARWAPTGPGRADQHAAFPNRQEHAP